MFNKEDNKARTDKEGFSTSVTPLGNGRYGVRVLLHGVVIREDNKSRSRQEAASTIKESLRWVDKLGWTSSMAWASRDRGCRKNR